MPRVGLIKVKS